MTAKTFHRLLYLATDVFSKGGIERYSRAQIQALRELLGEENVATLSVHPPREDPFEDLFPIDYVGQGLSLTSRISFVIGTGYNSLRQRPNLVWANHIGLLPLANAATKFSRGSCTVVNVYGREMWSGLPLYKRRALQRAAHVISDCHFTADYVQRTFGIPERRVSVIWDPVDVSKFVPRNTAAQVLPRYGVPYRSEACYLMTLGRVSEVSRHKGYDRMLDIMGQITRDDVIYLVAGDGNDRLRLEKRVRDEGLGEHVFFLGSIPESDLTDVYNTADVFVLVSDRGQGRGEGVPLTPLEAAACGKPIIVGDEDGSPEAVDDGENGYIVSPRDPDAIRRAILGLADDPSLCKKMGKAARLRVERDFSYQAFKARTAEVLGKLS